MKIVRLSLEPTLIEHEVSVESLALAAWYDSQPSVRRLWGIRIEQKLKVIVTVEATLDNSDVLPIWLARRIAWTEELRLNTGAVVQLELLDELSAHDVHLEAGGVVIADLFWRDSTLTG